MRVMFATALLAAGLSAWPPAQRRHRPLRPAYRSTATLPNLGPAGNGRRKWVQFGCYLCHGSNGAGQFGPNIQHADSGI